MSLLDPTPASEDPDRLILEATRTCDRLRSLSLVRLAAVLPDGRSRARAVFDLAQDLADAASGLAGRPTRMLPELADPAAGDVLAVCAQDLAEEVIQAHSEASAQACRSAVEGLVVLRRTL
ncbi:MAG TPA: hypothetical protein VES95_08850 [Dermatophilaceae bacterium]|nr:hypothetical protein [Dermatophilaceae bacterium]